MTMSMKLVEYSFLVAVFLLFVTLNSSTELPLCERKLLKNGFHREIQTTLVISSELMPDVTPDGDVSCFLMFAETIPTGAFVDPYQLKSLKPFGGPDVLISQDVDLEKPEFESDKLTVIVYTDLSHVDGAWSASYTLPVHMRYHEISDKADYANVTFTKPDIAVRCQIKEYGMQFFGYRGSIDRQDKLLCASDTIVLCDWSFIPVNMTGGAELTIQVPVGRREHYLPVMAGTVLVTFVACVLLVQKASYFKTTKVS